MKEVETMGMNLDRGTQSGAGDDIVESSAALRVVNTESIYVCLESGAFESSKMTPD